MTTMKRNFLFGLAIAGLLSAAISVQLAGAGGGPPTATVGPYHFHSNDFKIDSKEPSDVVMPSFTILPGHSNRWHVHPGPGYIIVTAGTLTLYRSTDAGCERTSYGPGEGFVEVPGQVHIARNEGTTHPDRGRHLPRCPRRDRSVSDHRRGSSQLPRDQLIDAVNVDVRTPPPVGRRSWPGRGAATPPAERS